MHAILKKHKSNYIILEDSICRAPPSGGCRLPDLIDVDNGVVSWFRLVLFCFLGLLIIILTVWWYVFISVTINNLGWVFCLFVFLWGFSYSISWNSKIIIYIYMINVD